MNKQKILKALSLLELNAFNAGFNQKAIELLKEVLEPEPKPKFYNGQRVLVRSPSERWRRGVLTTISTVGNYRFLVGGVWYLECKPDPKARSIPNWLPANLKEDELVPEGHIMVITTKDKEPIVYPEMSQISFSKEDLEYAILPLPEYL